MNYYHLLIAPLTLAILLPLTQNGCSNRSSDEEITYDKVRNTVLTYLMFRKHGGAPFEDQLFPNINPVLFDPRDRSIYFTLSDEDCNPSHRSQRMESYVFDTNAIAWSRLKADSSYSIGAYRNRWSERQGCACKTDLENIKIDTSVVLTFPYQRATFQISLRELTKSLDDRYIYGGKKVLTDYVRSEEVRFYNHGALVTHKEEPSLARLTKILLEDIPQEHREERIQRLLDFVSDDIVYDDWEGRGERELLKRPTESLMYGKTDCGNKSILFASLLEQIDEKYLLVYSPEHLSVAVPLGKFSQENEHHFEWDDQIWVSCETTLPNFRIGVDRIQGYYTFETIRYLQQPDEERGLINPHTSRVVGGL